MHLLLRQFQQNNLTLRNGILCAYRMCNKDVNKFPSAGQCSTLNETATYGVPEYYQYNKYSFNDMECEMEKYRLPPPSSKADQKAK